MQVWQLQKKSLEWEKRRNWLIKKCSLTSVWESKKVWFLRPERVTKKSQVQKKRRFSCPEKEGWVWGIHKEQLLRRWDYQSEKKSQTHTQQCSFKWHITQWQAEKHNQLLFCRAPKQTHRAASCTDNSVPSGSQHDRTVFDPCIWYQCGYKQESNPSSVLHAIPS